ncbi:hypothetical protein HZ992_16555 [Rhizobacter sp. AJA081-3]|uniref:hypothetical protein n=1 Tax=Rhizobacter sp. AJA081-3 TaxID=2753607 RepID=UPI001AE04842|nr:hypothetical protein [Rhizobacter sp. AJA081-3]QTN21777.1 hypothetical protein HZ992_16555 [Rhizobacter sp. AJA081-3]
MDKPMILRRGDKEVVAFTTPSGVRAYVATCFSDEVLRRFATKLKRKIRDRDRRLAKAVPKGTRLR